MGSSSFTQGGLELMSSLRFTQGVLKLMGSLRFTQGGLEVMGSLRFTQGGLEMMGSLRFTQRGLEVIVSLIFAQGGLKMMGSLRLPREDKNVSHGTSRNDNIPHSHHTKKATVFPPTEVQNFSVSDAESEKWTSDSSVITEMEKEKSKGVQLPDKGWHEGGMRCHVPACGSKEFDTFNSYQAHWKQIHSDTIKEFKCPLCSFKHSEKLQLQRHLRLKHKVDKTALQAMLSIMKVEVSPNEQYIDPGTVEFPKGKVHDFSGSEGKTKRPRLSAAQVLEIKQGSGGEKKSTKQTDFSDPAAASNLGSDLGIQSDNRRHVDDFGFEDKRILQVRLKADMAATISKEENVSNDIVKQVAVLERKETEINESVNMVTESYVDIKRDDADVDKATVEGDNSIDTQVLECVTKLKESVVEMKRKVIIESEKTIDTQVSESFTNVTESAIQMEIKFADVDKGTIEMEKAIDTQVLECAPKITECAVQTADVDKGTIEMDKAMETWVFECAPKITEYAVQIADVDKGTIEMDKAIDTRVFECAPKITEYAVQIADVDKGTIEMDKAIDTQVLECVPKIKECGIQTTDVDKGTIENVDKGTIEMDKAIDTQVLECVPKITECAIQTADVDKGTIEMDKETQVSVCVGTSDIQRNVDSKKVSKAARKIETVTDSASNFYITSDRIRKEADKSINEIPETSCLRIRQREDEDKINPPVETETVNDKERHEIYISYDTVIRKGDDKSEYNYKDQSECDIKDQGECDIKDQGECDIKDQGECDIKDQGECDIKDQGECDIKDQGECDIKDQSECDIKDQGECDIKDQSEYDIKDQSECDIKDQSDYDESDQDLSVTDDSELDEAKEAEDLDTVVRPIFLDGQMLCPGSGCFNLDQVYGSLKAFYKHWQDEHRSSVQRFECPCCSFKDVRKLEIRRHLKTEHHTRHRGVLEELMSLVKLEGTPKTAEDSKSETISKRKSASQLKTKIKKQKILLVSDAHETKDGKDTKDKSPKDEGANKAQIQCVSESNEKLLPKKEKVVWFFGMSCPVKNCCTRKFMSPREFHNHWENVHNPYIKKFECHICQYQNTQREVVGNHLRLSHNAVNTNDVRDLSQIKMVNVGNPMYKDPGMFYFGNVPIENQDVKATSTMSPVQAGTDGIPELKKTEDTGTQAKKENMKISKDIVPVHWVSGLTCPVMNCGASHFMTFLSFQNHWENIHNKNIFKFKCPKCTFTNISKPNIISHLSVKHKMSNAKIEFKTKYIQNFFSDGAVSN
ncbi:hypothetical protein ACJMK2_023090 [Sinanodonta woodiana]|uniref:C2H2-type domain-containing protein n=1 Tax=Sinanodonta woodiana TaxID=1069815 RepID=A0ABD3T329_SINWO